MSVTRTRAKCFWCAQVIRSATPLPQKTMCEAFDAKLKQILGAPLHTFTTSLFEGEGVHACMENEVEIIAGLY